MAKQLVLGLALLLVVESRSAIEQQQPLLEGPEFDLIQELRTAEIIPTVIDEFKPFLTVAVDWKKYSADVGNTIKPKKLQIVPDVQLRDHLPHISGWSSDDAIPQLTLALTDPDAKSRDNPKWSQMLHWLITDVPLTRTGQDIALAKNFTEIYPYKPPGPPPKTGKHRYVFVALAPKNGTTAKLSLSKPKDRQHWGYGKVRAGVREWSEENGLEVVGANFIYAQDKKQ